MTVENLEKTSNTNPGSVVFTLAVLASIAYGFSVRDEFYYRAEDGIGYALGIIGGVMMLIILAYPLHKYFRFLGSWLTLQRWFQIHMVLGVIGPLCVLFHSNFSLGSVNSNVALFSMLLMVFSGLVGRFIYTKIHYGLYGRKSTIESLKKHRIFAAEQLERDANDYSPLLTPDILKALNHYEKAVMRRRNIVLSGFRMITMGIRTRYRYVQIVRQLRSQFRLHAKSARHDRTVLASEYDEVRSHVKLYMMTLRRLVQLRFYERMFSIWHTLHLPIFLMLICTGFLHVYAVHSY